MKNKLLVSVLIISLFTAIICSQVFAANNNAMNSVGNSLKNAGNSIGNAATKTKDAIVNGAENLTNDAANMGNKAMNGIDNAMTGTMNAMDTNTNTDYTATRTATTGTTGGGFLGMSTTLSTWVILGVVGAIIVGLIWYYGAQYEHKNYNND